MKAVGRGENGVQIRGGKPSWEPSAVNREDGGLCSVQGSGDGE